MTARGDTPGSGRDGRSRGDGASGEVSAVDVLREIEFDRATGKLSEADYGSLKSAYTARALAELRAPSAEPPAGEPTPSARSEHVSGNHAIGVLLVRGSDGGGRGVLHRVRALSDGRVPWLRCRDLNGRSAVLQRVRRSAGGGRCAPGD